MKKGGLIALGLLIVTALVTGLLFYLKKNIHTQPPTTIYSYDLENGISFKSPIELITEKAGADAIIASPKEPNKKDSIYTVIYQIPDQQTQDMPEDAILSYAKSTYLGSATPTTDKVQRNFFGKMVEGSSEQTTIPNSSTLETYLVHLPSGKLLFIGIKYSLSKTEADNFINTLATTLKEI